MAFKVIAPHSMFGLKVANDGLDSLAVFEPASVMPLIRLGGVPGCQQTLAGFWPWEIVGFCWETALMIVFSCNPSRPNEKRQWVAIFLGPTNYHGFSHAAFAHPTTPETLAHPIGSSASAVCRKYALPTFGESVLDQKSFPHVNAFR